jgi:hypothetical protein
MKQEWVRKFFQVSQNLEEIPQIEMVGREKK